MTRAPKSPASPEKVRNEDIARAFDEVAELLDLENDNPFRVRAYRNAARTLRGAREEVADMIARGGDPDDLPGIGKDLAAQIGEMVASGRLSRLDRLRPEVPALALELSHVPGVGPRRAMDLCEGLKPRPRTLDDVLAAGLDGKVRALPGFGALSEQKLVERLQAERRQDKRFKRASVRPYAEALVERLRADPSVEAAEVAGSYRRGKETVGDLDLIAVSETPARVTKNFVAAPNVDHVLAEGRTKASVVLKSGVQVDLRAVARENFGAAMLYFTGSKAHNIALRRLAQQRGLKINEYGVFRGKERLVGADEAEIYRLFDLAYVPPELREDSGEIEAAARGALPRLVRLSDVKGDLHVHTNVSDGANSLSEMVQAARERGLDYIAVTDHSQSMRIAHGLNRERLLAQIDAVDHFNAENPGFKVLKGAEVDILPDGALDLADDLLHRLDLVVAAIHSDFGLPREKQTERILRALDNRFVFILAHPTGRLLFERDAYDIDMARVLRAAHARGSCLEINGQPDRLDINDAYCRMAKSEGVRLSVDSDAHGARDFINLEYAVAQARRGWLEAGDIVNALPVSELKALIAASR
ncbi:DNA polymerase/3'-5' exonuclease PolX [Rhodoblastus acidophilus]|uniref:DNA-directed DNA polymerase n=1 Tax=Candidatus Rhodoblastus alkanivorans TaxID=2954117 RepID=A0ABS9Z7I7_9HYPH|nr:DNA polymerase/3'-5' exonuclease PolX [Candidatus Rhodoblastus alkanivorans]MCI4679166.1 DNA polymerase/3'-5' exonuclease PolX [Candidatus Rhodoblastus alkanivorans]MCI4683162.1 DNA polymerase/3'-5' exonuclease PolX [Candidatus Rhodoblastus alkanivorans]MDI4640473.1 DNA polymerase/3'-5' exonuclease PolX [Rhodoblastus acidophilus]